MIHKIILKNKYYYKPVIIILLSSLIIIASTTTIPFANKYLIDDALNSKQFNQLIFAVLLFLGSSVFLQAFQAILQIQFAKVESHLMLDIRRQMHIKVQNYRFIDMVDPSRLVAIFVNDLNIIKLKFRSLLEIILSALQLLLLIGIMIYIDYRLLGLVFITIILYSYWPNLVGKRILKISGEIQLNLEHITSSLYDSFNFRRETRIYNQEKSDHMRVDSFFSKAIQPVVQLEKLNALYILGNIIFSILLSVLILFGGKMVINGELTTGTLVAIITYLGYISDPVQSIVANYSHLKNIEASEKRVAEVFKIQEIVAGHHHIIAGNPVTIRLEDVSLNYEHKEILQKVNLEMNQGDFIALTGHSGCGKSSILMMMSRMIFPSVGSIKIQDRDIETFEKHNFYSIVKHVFQDSKLLQGTIADNLFLHEAHDRNSIVELICSLDLEFLIEASALDEVKVEENGANFSGGQIQRIALLRALLYNPPILLLDEVTSALDEKTEQKVMLLLQKLRKDKITLFVTHRKSVLTFANRVIEVRDGSLVEMREEIQIH